MRKSVLVLSLTALSLGACSTVVETVQGPQLAPIGYPAQLVPVRTRLDSARVAQRAERRLR